MAEVVALLLLEVGTRKTKAKALRVSLMNSDSKVALAFKAAKLVLM